MGLARSACQRVVNVIEDIGESLTNVRAPRLARRRSSSWVPTSTEAEKASTTSQSRRLRRASSMHLADGSLDSRYSDASSALLRRRSSDGTPLTRSTNASLAQQYSKHGLRGDSLFFTDSINVTTGAPEKLQLSIKVQRGGNGPLKYTVDVPKQSGAEFHGIDTTASRKDRMPVFHDPFASAKGRGNVNITINLKDGRKSQYFPGAPSSTSDRRGSRSVPTSPTTSSPSNYRPSQLETLRADWRRSFRSGQAPPSEPSLDHPNKSWRASLFSKIFSSEEGLSPHSSDASDPLSALFPTSAPSPTTATSARTPALPVSPGLAMATVASASSLLEPGNSDSIVTSSSLGTSIVSYLRRAAAGEGHVSARHASERPSRAVSLYSTTNGPVPDTISVRSPSFDEELAMAAAAAGIEVPAMPHEGVSPIDEEVESLGHVSSGHSSSSIGNGKKTGVPAFTTQRFDSAYAEPFMHDHIDDTDGCTLPPPPAGMTFLSMSRGSSIDVRRKSTLAGGVSSSPPPPVPALDPHIVWQRCEALAHAQRGGSADDDPARGLDTRHFDDRSPYPSPYPSRGRLPSTSAGAMRDAGHGEGARLRTFFDDSIGGSPRPSRLDYEALGAAVAAASAASVSAELHVHGGLGVLPEGEWESRSVSPVT